MRLLAAVICCIVACRAQELPAPAKKTGVTARGVQIPLSRLQPDAVFDVPGAPDWIVVDDSVWISNKPRNSITRIDPRSNRVTEVIPAGSQPCAGLAVGFGSLWVPNCGGPTLSRIDLQSGRVTATIATTIADTEGSIAAGAGSIWLLTDGKSTLTRFDPATNRVVAEILVAPGSYAAAFGEDAIWVTSTLGNLVTRVDPRTNRVVASIPVGPAPRFLAVGGGAVWTLKQGDGSVSRIDPRTNRVIATIEVGVPGEGGDIAVGEGSVWVTSFDYPVSRIDPVRNQVVQQFVGKGGDAIRVGHGSVWLSNLKAENVWRIDVRRFEAVRGE